ncbi:hypothetical protein [Vibrio gallaecicus]|uniref:hypothetical protein n=2 Tax=Vibrio gallaecicus TaxID=552386 RepID=UPI0015D17E05|nr:hypothetical protein [Vibrio gallaecicus]MDN3617339.1 hypothetical protein [Vibrio gallaecicus]
MLEWLLTVKLLININTSRKSMKNVFLVLISTALISGCNSGDVIFDCEKTATDSISAQRFTLTFTDQSVDYKDHLKPDQSKVMKATITLDDNQNKIYTTTIETALNSGEKWTSTTSSKIVDGSLFEFYNTVDEKGDVIWGVEEYTLNSFCVRR